MRIAVVDGMGGGLGAQIITKVKPLLSDKDEILALGANAIATAAMIKAGAALGATGENAVWLNVGKTDLILGPVGIAIPHSLLGEITTRMAEAVALSSAIKILIPTNQTQGHFYLAGAEISGLNAALEDLVDRVRQLIEKES
ncbi:MAG: DUF3842 family protein [Chthonomonadales bacterium]